MQELLNYIHSLECNLGIYYKNLKTQRVFEFKSDKVFSSASTIKVPILLALFNKELNGELDLNKRISLKEGDFVGGAGILNLLNKNNTYTILDLAKLMIVLSDNTATNVIIDLLGIDYINNYFKEVGLEKTILQRRMMDFYMKNKGFDNYTTARDLGIVFEKIYKKEILNSYYCDLAIKILKEQKLKGGLDRYIGEKYKIAHKTGDLKKLEHDCGIIFKEEPIVIVVLTEGDENYKLKDVIGKIAEKII
ncbi:MAG: class A beta-lactamase-related serine hydrolase [Caloramator sp.]|nr:class A beta-lactamase-related serine hydrolase [Caloramator sp.]